MVRIGAFRGNATIAEALRCRPGSLLFLWLAILGAVAFLAPQASVFDGSAARVALGAALGGAASNLLGRPLYGGVDYVDLRIWPPFNLADAGIVVGVIVALAA